MKKAYKILIIIGIVLAVLIIGLITAAMVAFGSTKAAYLQIESGEVQVNQGEGYFPAVDMMDLKESDFVKTLEGTAVIIFYDSSFIELEPNTEIQISKLSEKFTKVTQNSGSAWSKFTKITGMAGYEVETPNTVATVRGTEFNTKTGEEDAIIVSEGLVKYSGDEEYVDVEEFEKYVKKLGQNFEKQELTSEEREMIMNRIEKNIRTLKQIRENRLMRMGMVKMFRNFYDVEEGKELSEREQIRELTDSIDSGETDDKQMMKQFPLVGSLPEAKKFVNFNELIKEENSRMQRLRAR